MNTALTILEMFDEAFSENKSNYESFGMHYAPDLTTPEQKMFRAKNLAIRSAAARYMLQEQIGYDWVKPDIIEDKHRAKHYGVAIGTMVGYNARKSVNYYTRLAHVMKQLRKQIKTQNSEENSK